MRTADTLLTKDKIRKENEENTNFVVAFVMILFSILSVSIIIFHSITSNFSGVDDDSRYSLFIISVVTMIPALIQFIFPGKIKWMTYWLSFWFVIIVGVTDFFYDYHASALICIPTVLSTRYYSKKLTIVSIVLTVLTLFTSSTLSYLFVSNNLSLSPITDSFVNWTDFGNVMVNSFSLKTALFSIAAAISISIVTNGNEMVKKEAIISDNITSMKHELKTARRIQDQVLPTDFEIARDKGYQIYAKMVPAKEVAGDFYDFFVIKNNVYFLVGDVSDKGVYAAMVMMNVKNIIQSLALTIDDPAQILTLANKLTCKGNDSLMFITIWMGVINSETRKGYFVNAGHNSAFIRKNNSEFIRIENDPDPAVGLFQNYEYRKHELEIKEDETIVLYTDGATDIINEKRESFGEERLLECIKSSGTSPKNIVDNIGNKLQEFRGNIEQYDDITLLAVNLEKFDNDQEYECKYESIDEIIDLVNSSLNSNNVNETTIGLIDTALDDAINNIISYAYKGQEGKGKFRFQFKYSENKATFVISDNGVEFNPNKAKTPILSGSNRKVGGLGIHLIKSIMDEVNYSRESNKNILVLVKYIKE